MRQRAGGSIEAAIVLGSGLAQGVRERVDGKTIAYKKLPGAPQAKLAGHPGYVLCGLWSGKRVAVFAGRAHLYQGFAGHEVTYSVRVAAASGAGTIVLTNAAGGLNAQYARGDLMLIADHLNLTGATPLGPEGKRDPFLSLSEVYTHRLRALAQTSCGNLVLHEGVYAGVRGPAYETPAEARALRVLGADAVGMSTVLEAIEARALAMDVLGISLISNLIGADHDVSHSDVLAAARDGAERIAQLVEGVLARLPHKNRDAPDR